MASHFHSAIKADYPFLAHPPLQNKRPLQSLRHRSSTFSSIAAWAAHVQPGSPACLSPRSPLRCPSISVGKGHRPSIASTCAASAAFLHIAPTPTPSTCDFKADLTALGYTSVFLELPNTPISASLTLSIKPSALTTVRTTAVPPHSSISKPRGFARFRSLSTLRSRARSKSACADSPIKMKDKAATASATIAKRKKAKYAMRPPPLINELALMQFADGGSMDDNIKRVMEVQAKDMGTLGLGDVYRDGKGGVWWDQDEEWEYTHLLAEGDESRPSPTGDLQWVTFGGNMSPSATSMPGEERRGSVSTQDSDLDPKYIIQPTDILDGDDFTLSGGAIVPLATRKSISDLSLPPRSHRAAKHLRKPDSLVDVEFLGLHTSPKSPKVTSLSDKGVGMLKPKGKARKRPAPLKLSPSSPPSKQPTNSPVDADQVRKDFIDASFTPAHVSIPASQDSPATIVCMATPVNVMRAPPTDGHRAMDARCRTVNDSLTSLGMSLKKKPTALNMMGLFRSARKGDLVR